MNDEGLAEIAYQAYCDATMEPGSQVASFGNQNEEIKFAWVQAILAVKSAMTAEDNKKEENQDAVEEK